MSKFYDLDLEQCILLSCIENNNNIDEAANVLNSQDFSHPMHTEIFEYLLNKRNINEIVDLRQLKINFPKATDDFWSSLSQQNSFVDVASYSKTLKNLSIKSKLHSLIQVTNVELANITDNVEDYTLDLNAKIYKLLSGIYENSLKSAKTAIDEFYKELDRVSQRLDKDIIGIDTGYSMLNRHTKGFKAGELIILGARPGMGKTTLALNILLHTLKNDVGVVFYSLETEAFKIMAKLIALNTGIRLSSITTGELDSLEIEKVQNSANMLSEKSLFIYDKGSLTIELLRTTLRRIKENNPNIEFCIVDYLQLMTSNVRADRHVQVSEISRGLKLLALELKISILALSQVNRQIDTRSNEKRKLMLSDLRESGSIEQDADLVLFINSNEIQDENSFNNSGNAIERYVSIDIAKNRSGELASIPFNFEASKARFSQIIREGNINERVLPQNTEEL